MDLEIMNLFVDLLLLGLAHIFFPARRGRPKKYWDEDSARWIILDSPQDFQNNRNVNQMPERDETDPFLNGEYDDGPDW